MENIILYTSPYSKQRIGKQNDGGYVITHLPGKYDVFLSGGISNDISFEEDFLIWHPEQKLTCFAFDGTINGLPTRPTTDIRFIRKNLGATNTEHTTNLQEYMKEYNDIFMKIDIEGHEFRLLPNLVESGYIRKIKQLVVEIHSPADITMFPNYFRGLSDITNDKMFDLLKNLNNSHTLIHFHANNGCKMSEVDGIKLPHVFELTYIRNEFITEKKRNTEKLPTQLDMPNTTNKPDYELFGFPYSN